MSYIYVEAIKKEAQNQKNKKQKQFSIVLIGSVLIMGIAVSSPSPDIDKSMVDHYTEPATVEAEAKEKTEAVTSDSKSSQETTVTTSVDDLGVFVNESNRESLITKTKTFLDKYSPGSPVSPESIVKSAESKGFALDLVLVQGTLESNWCTKGRAVTSKQCLNVGAYTEGDTKPTSCTDGLTWCMSDYSEGLDIYYKYMLDCHFHPAEKPTIQRFVDRDFRIIRQGSKICGPIGGRYATSSAYRQKFISVLQNQLNPIFS